NLAPGHWTHFLPICSCRRPRRRFSATGDATTYSFVLFCLGQVERWTGQRKRVGTMCGIIGILGKSAVAPLLLDGLRRLEYRGYDSTGMATLANGHIERRRAPGKLVNLSALLERQPLPGTTGIGHTRWATHGRPNEANAHPHATDRVAIVHNGIIENHQGL